MNTAQLIATGVPFQAMKVHMGSSDITVSRLSNVYGNCRYQNRAFCDLHSMYNM